MNKKKKDKSIDETEINEEDIISVEDFDLPDRTKGFFGQEQMAKINFTFRNYAYRHRGYVSI